MSKAKNKGKKRDSSGLAWFGLGVVSLLAIAAAFFIFRTISNVAVYDEVTLCPSDGPTSSIVVLLDLTDPVSETQSQTIRRILLEQILTAPAGTLVSVGMVSVDPGEWGARFSRCKPEIGENANEFYQNPVLIAERYHEEFELPLFAAIENLLEANEQPQSPIIESLQRLVEDALTLTAGAPPERLIVVSDLIQNSDRVSFYACQGWDHFRASGEQLSANLLQTRVTMAWIRRPGAMSSCVVAELEPFWARYLDVKGASGQLDIVNLSDI